MNADTDSDGDGTSNLRELCFETDPHDQRSTAIVALQLEGPGRIISFPSSSNPALRYGVFWTDQRSDLSGAAVWRPLVQGLPGTGQVMTVNDSAVATGTRFYRVAVEVAQ